jgi:predicted RNA-binding protein with PIN domain
MAWAPILYSKKGQTADDIIERVATRLTEYGEVLVVTDDQAERDTIMAAGAQSVSCEHFIRMLRDASAHLETQLARHNRAERQKYRRDK